MPALPFIQPNNPSRASIESCRAAIRATSSITVLAKLLKDSFPLVAKLNSDFSSFSDAFLNSSSVIPEISCSGAR